MSMMKWKIDLHRQKTTTVILCDDDPEFASAFKDEILLAFEKINSSAEVTVFRRSSDISDEVLASCDMAFFDIDLEEESGNGIDLARRLRGVNTNAVVFFVTNFIDYAPEGYEVRAFRYILKRDRNDVLERYILQAVELIAEKREYLNISDGDSVVEFLIDDISYLEVINHAVFIHAKYSTHTLYASLSSLEEQLEKCGFLRIHNSYLVNMRFIGKYRSRECILTDGTVLPASERSYSAQKQKYLLWKGLK